MWLSSKMCLYPRRGTSGGGPTNIRRQSNIFASLDHVPPYTNVRPCVARNPSWRDESTVRASKVSPSQVYEVTVTVSLFFSHLSLGNQSATRKSRGLGHAVDHSVHSVESRISCSPLLQHDHSRIFNFWSNFTIALSRKSIVPSFDSTQPSETSIPGVSPRGASRDDSLASWRKDLARISVLTLYRTENYIIFCTIPFSKTVAQPRREVGF
jgi:hypothetical protein